MLHNAWMKSVAIMVAFCMSIFLAQFSCGMHDIIIGQLKDKYGEMRRGIGFASPQVIFEIWISEKTGSWTILRVLPNGWTCFVAVGSRWMWYPYEVGEPI